MYKKRLTGLLLAFFILSAFPALHGQTAVTEMQQPHGSVVTFKFVPAKDMFYIPWSGNDAELGRLYSLVDDYHSEITSGRMPVYVDGYCASLSTEKDNLNTAFTRSNRVKSELITHKSLSEEHFITKNHAAAYEGQKDIVVVSLRTPVKAEEPKAEVKPEPRPEPKREEPVKEQKPETVVETKPQPAVQPTGISNKPYCFAVRTNLLYDAFLLPTLGLEWRVSPAIGVKVDGSGSAWGDEHGKVQKIWLVNPEVRWYFGQARRLYAGASANFGEYNIYKGMIGGMLPDDKGYQGKLWNAGLTVGYQLPLSKSFAVDFNLGLGYTSFDYDSYTVTNETRVYIEKDKTNNFFGPTQAGVTLVWTIGGNKLK